MSRAITKGVICMADVSVDIGVKIDESGIKKPCIYGKNDCFGNRRSS